MMRLLSILCILVFAVTIFGLNEQSAYAEEVISVKSVSLDNSSILELKNNRGNNFNIDSVRIWLAEDNSFKSFKTEQGWTGKFEVGGKVLVFSPQNSVKPGESVKFGLKTDLQYPVINWKALDGKNQIIQSAATITKKSDTGITPEINKPELIAIKDNSNFRLIPQVPTIGSDFRIVGENFIPNQSLELYIADQMVKLVTIGSDGKFISTASIPDNLSADRTQFTLVDSGGTEKTISMRIMDVKNREMSEDVKIQIGFTNKTVKRGDIISLEGSATPDTTLTLTTKDDRSKVLNITTLTTDFDGKWTSDLSFPVNLKLGKISLEITDGKTIVVRDFDLISSQLINIDSEKTRYEVGDTIKFTGTAIPNNKISVVVTDPVGVEVFSETLNVDGTGNITFDIDVSIGFLEGTYVLTSYQGNESAISVVGVGEKPQEVLLVTSSALNYSVGETVDLLLRGEPHANVSLVIIDESDKTKANDSIELDENGNYIYYVETDDIGTGAFTVELRYGNTRGTTVFTVGLSTGSGQINFQTTKTGYYAGEQILIIGNTGNSVLLNVEITDPDNTMIRSFETFSDRSGIFKVDSFRVPANPVVGVWTISISSGENISKQEFSIQTESQGITVSIQDEKESYSAGEILKISGKDASLGAAVNIIISDSEGTVYDNLLIYGKANGEFYTIWVIPSSFEAGIYEISVSDSVSAHTTSFTVG